MVGFILVTAPGEPIRYWDQSGDFFTTINDRVNRALSELPAGVKVRGVLWHQGESDHASTDYYSEKLDDLIGNIRAKGWFASDGVFVCGETLNSPVNERLSALNDDFDLRTGCVSSAGLQSVGDNVHFNAESLRQLGGRYATKYLELTR